MADVKLPDPEQGRQVKYVLADPSPNAGQIRTATIVIVHEYKDEADKVANPGLVNLNVAVGKVSDIRGTQHDNHANILACGVRLDQVTKAPGTWHWPEHAIQTPKVLAQAPKGDK